MEHNLDDTLNLEGTIGVDFEHGEDTVVNQEDITLDTSGQDETIPMEFQHIEEQPILMDTENEEIIDFMGEQFTLQEYSVPDNQVTGATTTMEANFENENLLSSKGSDMVVTEDMMDMQYGCTMYMSASGELTTAQAEQQLVMPKIINVKSATPVARPIAIAAKKDSTVVAKSVVPRQVAIAPKPPRLAQVFGEAFGVKKQLAIAPKPMKAVVKPVTLVTKQSLSMASKTSANEQTAKGNTVIAQIGGGKQLVMVPQKIKVVTSGSGPIRLLASGGDNEQAQLIPTQAGSQGQKKLMAKVVVQGSSSDMMSNQPAVITKLLPAGSTATPQTKYVNIQQKTIPISIGNNKVLVTSPSKFGKKQQLLTIKSPTPKLLPAPQGAVATKKVVISANPAQKVVLKSAGTTKTGQITKNVGQRTQLHQINVPGKGIQYIRLVTNPSSAMQKQVVKPQVTSAQGKTFVLTDSKGNLIRMTAEKVNPSAPPPLIVTSGQTTRAPSKPQQKLVRIAPITSKSSQQPTMPSRASGKSLLAPLSPAPAPAPAPAPSLPSVEDLLDEQAAAGEGEGDANWEGEREEGDDVPHHLDDTVTVEEVIETSIKHEQPDSKAALRALIADAVGDELQPAGDRRACAARCDRQSPETEDSNSSERPESPSSHPVIVIPSTYIKPDMMADDHSNYNSELRYEEKQAYSMDFQEERSRFEGINVDVDYSPYLSPNASQVLAENDIMAGELVLRARKACNCTKSQCLKLYCDCFANGEFCHRCNCTNCHNNLDNEELRQKAIRGCLDRNPNAFRPKIGKTKAGGPEIIRRHNKGCNCKRSGCLKNYCECYEAKIACTSICKCVGCRNVEETLERRRRDPAPDCAPPAAAAAAAAASPLPRQPCSFMTHEVIEAVCQCLIAAAVEAGGEGPAEGGGEREPLREVLDEFARCLHDIISASHHAPPSANLRRDEPQHV